MDYFVSTMQTLTLQHQVVYASFLVFYYFIFIFITWLFLPLLDRLVFRTTNTRGAIWKIRSAIVINGIGALSGAIWCGYLAFGDMQYEKYSKGMWLASFVPFFLAMTACLIISLVQHRKAGKLTREMQARSGSLPQVMIDGKSYLLSLPTGGNRSRSRQPNDWDTAVSLFANGKGIGNTLHCRSMVSWCRDILPGLPPFHPIRGGDHYWSATSPLYRRFNLGYRPILRPLNPETMEPDPSLLANVPDGTVLSMGTLFMNETPLDVPRHPGITKEDGHAANEKGRWMSHKKFVALLWQNVDVPDYIAGAQLRLGDSVSSKQIPWVKCGDFLIADRNLLKNISWTDLDRNGLVFRERGK